MNADCDAGILGIEKNWSFKCSCIVGVVDKDLTAIGESGASLLGQDEFRESLLCSTMGRWKSFHVEEIRDDAALSSRSESSNVLSGLAKGTLSES